MEKIEPIIIQYEDGREYTLEFSRKTVEFAEKNGFSREAIEAQMMTRVPELFWYAFRMHHPYMTKQQTDEILFNDLGGLTEEMCDRLVDLYNEPLLTLYTEDGTPKNPQMKVIL